MTNYFPAMKWAISQQPRTIARSLPVAPNVNKVVEGKAIRITFYPVKKQSETNFIHLN